MNIKTSLAISSILLSSVLIFPAPSFAFQYVPDSPKQIFPSNIPHAFKYEPNRQLPKINAKRSFKQDRFTELLSEIQNNEINFVDMWAFPDLTKAQILQLIAALKTNTSVQYFLFIDDNGKFFHAGQGKNDPDIAQALANLVTTNTSLQGLILQGTHYGSLPPDGSKPYEYYQSGTLDPQSFQQLLAGMQTNTTLSYFGLWDWNIDANGAASLAKYLQQTTSLENLVMYLAPEPTVSECDDLCNANVAQIVKAIGDNKKLEALSLEMKTSLNPSPNSTVMQALAKSMIKNTAFSSIDVHGFSMDVQTATTFSNVLAKSNKIDTLMLGNNNIDDVVFQALLPGLMQNNSITSFSIKKQNLKDHDTSGKQLVNYLATKSLEFFGIQQALNFALNNDDVQIIANKIAKDATLDVLILRNVGIDDNGAQLIANGLTQNNTLRSIDLYENTFDVIGVRAIASVLENNRSLVWIGIDNELLDKALSPEEIDQFYTWLNINWENSQITMIPWDTL